MGEYEGKFTSYARGYSDSTSRPLQKRSAPYLATAGIRKNPRRLTQITRGGRLTRKKLDRSISRWRILKIVSVFYLFNFPRGVGRRVFPPWSSYLRLVPPPGLARRGSVVVEVMAWPRRLVKFRLIGRNMPRQCRRGVLGRVGWAKCNQSPSPPGRKKWEKRVSGYGDVGFFLFPADQSKIGVQKGHWHPQRYVGGVIWGYLPSPLSCGS